MRVLVCGGRRVFEEGLRQDQAESFIFECLYSLKDPPEKSDIIFISGMAKGADQIPIELLKDDPDFGGLMEFPANWNKYGRKAGPLRNIQMLTEGKPDMVIAFPDSQSRGTYHMMRIATEAGIPVYVWRINE